MVVMMHHHETLKIPVNTLVETFLGGAPPPGEAPSNVEVMPVSLSTCGPTQDPRP